MNPAFPHHDPRFNPVRRDLLRAGGASALVAAPLMLGLNACTAQTPSAARDQRATIAREADTTLPIRTLGALDVTALGFGAMNVAHAYGPAVPRELALSIIRRAFDKGVRFFDSAEVYGPFVSEQRLGEALQEVRDEVVISTKFGFDITSDGQVHGLNSRPEHIKRTCDDCLRRLRTDRIDLFYQHRIDPEVPIEEVAGAVQDLIAAGKVLHFGLSGAGAASIRRAHAVQPVTAVQNHYAFWSRQPELEVLPVCAELGIGFVPWSPLGMGYLTGTVAAETPLAGENRANYPRFSVEARRANWAVVELLRGIGRPHGATPGQVALAWLMAQAPFIVPIPGTTKSAHLDENIGALDIRLDAQELKRLDDGFTRINIQGAYTGAAQMARMDLGEREGTRSDGTHGLSPLPGQ